MVESYYKHSQQAYVLKHFLSLHSGSVLVTRLPLQFSAEVAFWNFWSWVIRCLATSAWVSWNILFGSPEPSCKKSDYPKTAMLERQTGWQSQLSPAFQPPCQSTRHLSDPFLDPPDQHIFQLNTTKWPLLMPCGIEEQSTKPAWTKDPQNHDIKENSLVLSH